MDDLYFKMNGRAFVEGYRIDKVAAGLTSLQRFFDGVYKGLSGKERLSKKDRELFALIAQDFRDGSFLANFGAVMSGVQLALPLVSSQPPKDVWETVKTSYDFLTQLFSQAHKDPTTRIEHHGNGDVSVHNGSVTNNFNAPVFIMSKQIVGGLRDFGGLIDGQQVTSVELGLHESKDIEINEENKRLFFAPTSLDKDPRTIRCDIFDFNKYEKEGRLKVHPEQSVPAGSYKFKPVGSQEIEEYILSMAETEVTVNCLVEYEHDPLAETKIASLLVTGIAA